MEIKIVDGNYEFKYIDIVVIHDKISTDIEYYRWISIKKLKEKMFNILKRYNIKPIKNNLYTNIDNVVARILFENFSNDKITELEDGLLYYRKNSKSLLNDLKTTFKKNNNTISDNLCKKIINEISLENDIKKYINTIKNMNLEFKTNKINNIKIKKNKTKSNFCIEIPIHDKSVKLKIPIAVYIKLQNRYIEYKKTKKHTYKLDELITCLMMRYNSLSSIGNQMGIPIDVKKKLKDCDINFEGFASSFNHYCKYYCSMFYDIEKYFGSIGPYQNITYVKGIYMLNPPYEKNLLNNMVSNIIKNLDKLSKQLCFVFGTPTWNNYEDIYFHKNASESKYFKLKFVFDNYQVLWYDFLNENFTKIPSSTRYILSNYNIDLECIKQAITYWILLKQ